MKIKIEERYSFFTFGIWENDLVGYHKPERYHGFVYRITERRTGKFYIGKKSYAGNWKLYTSSSKPLNEEIAEKGFNAFSFDMVSIHDSEESMVIAERRLINSAKNLDENIYNEN